MTARVYRYALWRGVSSWTGSARKASSVRSTGWWMGPVVVMVSSCVVDASSLLAPTTLGEPADPGLKVPAEAAGGLDPAGTTPACVRAG